MFKFIREHVESGLFTVKASALSNTKDNICSILLYLLFNYLSVIVLGAGHYPSMNWA